MRAWIAALLLCLALPLQAATPLKLALLQLADDPRYAEARTDAELRLQPWGRPAAAAQVAMRESRFAAQALGIELQLQTVDGDAATLAAALPKLQAQGTRYFLLDLPAALIADLARRTRGQDLLLFNIAALDDALRGAQCQSQLLHVVPSHAMLSDALGQYLVAKQWRRVLLLQGPLPQDAQWAAAYRRTAQRYGLKLVDTRRFVLGSDPRQREQNNPLLLTAGDYDVVLVADANGEFARQLPGQTLRPQLVAGAAGLVPDWWHWSWERQGAPQLNHRLREAAGRRPTGYDWAAWMAVKGIVEAAQRGGSTDFAKIRAALLGEALTLDGFKGFRLGYRAWDRQLRQPLFLTSDNWVLLRAPLEGFLHPANALDTLGFDAKESACHYGVTP